MLLLRSPLCIIMLLLAAALPVRAEYLTLELYLAENSDIRNDVPASHPLRKSFDRLIGFDRYELLGSKGCPFPLKAKQELKPHRMFLLALNPGEGEKGLPLSAELFQQKRSIFKGAITPRDDAPLIITGPQYRNGKLVLVLLLTKNPPNSSPPIEKNPKPEEG